MAMEFTFLTSQSLTAPSDSNLRVTSSTVQYLLEPSGTNLRSTSPMVQYLVYQEPPPNFLTSTLIVQYLQLAQEIEVVTDRFPDLPGLTWEIHMKPTFSTKTTVHTSGQTTRTSYWENPQWTFDLIYDYLPNDRAVGKTNLEQLMGFFLKMNGAWSTFLYRFNEFSSMVNYLLFTGDGNTVETPFVMDFYGTTSPVGQVDTTAINLSIHIADEQHVVTGGAVALTYWHGALTNFTVVINGNVLLPVGAAPVGNQYVYDPTTGLITVNASWNGQTAHLTYDSVLVQGTDYTVSLPNTLVFAVAPPNAAPITATYAYFFICTFQDDQADFDAFMDKLWELQAISLRSEIG